MQTKQKIDQLLAGAGTRPNKRLGQNFLIDLNLMRFLIDTAGITRNDIVLEVGCGTGSFTEGIAEKAGYVVGIEYDRKLAPIAQRQLKDNPDVVIIQGDALENKHQLNLRAVELIKLARGKYNGRLLLVANLPYSVAASVMVNLAIGQPAADQMHVTVQKEVADRMSAKAGDKRYGPLSILLDAVGDVRMIRKLGPGVFWPAPQVDSAMVSFIRNESKQAGIMDMKLLGEIVHLFMGHRRKTLKACSRFAEGRLLGIENWQQIFDGLGINSSIRPEQLESHQYIDLANACSRLSGGK